MANLHPNSTNYVHTYEPNTGDLTMAMDYNNVGQPFVRTLGAGNYLGEQYTLPLIPVIQLNSYEGIRERDSQVYTGGGGSVADTDTTIDIACTSTLGSYGVYRSERFISYRSGQSAMARMLCKFEAGVAGTQQRVGIANQENAYYIGYNGTNFQFLHSSGGVAEIWELVLTNTSSGAQTITLTLNNVVYTVAIASGDTIQIVASKIKKAIAAAGTAWLADAVDGKVRLLAGTLGAKAGTFSYSSTGNVSGALTKKITGVAATDEWQDMPKMPSWVDTTKFHMWQFQYAWTGVVVQVQNPASGQFDFVHEHVLEDDGSELPVTKPAFKPSAVAYNVGGASGVTLKVASLAGFVEGREEITKYTNAGGATHASLASGTTWHLMSIQNPYVNEQYKINYRSVRFLDLTATVQCNDPVTFYIYYNQPKVSTANFTWTSYPNRIYQGDTTDGAFDTTVDTPIAALTVGINGQAQFDLRDYNMVIPPGTHMSLVAVSASTIQKATVSGVWTTLG